MKRLLLPLLLLLVSGCLPAASSPAPALTASPEVVMATGTPCEHHTAQAGLELSSQDVRAGEEVTATILLHNTGCLTLGVPQYRITVADGEVDLPDPVVHNLGVIPGSSDMVVFTFTPETPGTFQLRAAVSFEVHVGSPGPAYWGAADPGESVVLVVRP